MDTQILILSAAVLLASALQSATGIGFGMIAGPVMLIVLGSGAAIQISIALSLLIAVVLVPSLWGRVQPRVLNQLLLGTLIGLPLGLWVFMVVSIDLLKFLAGLAVLGTLAFLLFSWRTTLRIKEGARWETLLVGLVSGVMSGSLAMPGPVPAAWMAARGFDKHTLRATVLAMFVCSYLAALGMQAGIAGIASETLHLGMWLALPTLAGVYVGRLLAARLSEIIFRRILTLVLVATCLSLFMTSLPPLIRG